MVCLILNLGNTCVAFLFLDFAKVLFRHSAGVIGSFSGRDYCVFIFVFASFD